MNQDQDTGKSFLLWLLPVLAACLLPWLWAEHAKALNQDIYWLAVGAGRLLHGATMSGGIYDPNPPLSIIVYIPLYLFVCVTGLHYDIAAMLMALAYVVLAAVAVYELARRLLDGDEAVVLAVSFFLAGTVLATAEFGQRDQMVALSLLPFVLGQVMLTRRISCPRPLLYAVFAAGAVLVLLKPHFGLVPAMFLIYRAVRQKRWSVVRDPDFIILAGAALAYLALIGVVFRDYATVIFPDVIGLYLGFDTSKIVFVFAGGLAALYLAAWGFYARLDKGDSARRAAAGALFASALMALVPYVIEMKDYRYHLVPSLTFFWTGAGFFIFIAARRRVSRSFAAALMVALLCAAGYAGEPSSYYRTGAEITAQPLTRAVADCGVHCEFMMFTASLPTYMQTAYYAGADDASRFPSLWFLPQLLRMKPGPTGDRLFHKYAGFLAQDIETRRPDIVVACLDEFDYIAYFARDPGFAQAWKPYRAYRNIPVNYGFYFPERLGRPLPTYLCTAYRRAGTARAPR